MTKIEFMMKLSRALSGLPEREVTERIGFYGEMIDDRIEEGMTEEEAVLSLGTVESVADEIVAEIPLTRIVRERIRPKRALRAWEIVLLALGSPIWLSLLISALAVVFSLVASLWATVLSLWAGCFSLAVGGVAGVLGGAVGFAWYDAGTCMFLISAGFVAAGLSILAFFGCKALTVASARLTRGTVLGIKRMFIKKEVEA